MRAGHASSRTVVVDGALALALTVVSLPLLWLGDTQALLPDYAGPTPVAVAVVLTLTLPLAWRRRAPVAVLLTVGVAMVVAAGRSVPHPGLSVVLALYTVAADAPRRRALAGATFVALALLALVLADALRHIGINLVVLAAAWLLGDWRRLHRARTAELEHRTAALQRARADRARLAVAEERHRIAGELRDVLAHGVTAMVTQAQAASRVLVSDLPRAAGALLAVEQTGRAGLVELRRLVGLLRRTDPCAPPHDDGPPEPPEGQHRAAGALTTGRGRLRRAITAWPVPAQDTGLAALVLVLELSLQWLYRPGELGSTAYTGPTLATTLAVTAMAAILAFRRRIPQAVLAATLVGAVAVVHLEVPANLWAVLVALYTVGAHCRRRVSLTWLGATLGLAAVLVAVLGELGFLPGQVAVLATAWLLGDRQRVRLAYAAELEDRASSLEQARQRELAMAIADERARIARELHDLVAHSLGVMVVQAAGARRLADHDPERARVAVQQVVACGRDSLTRLRTVFRVLGGEQSLIPQPTLDDLPGLLEDFAEIGLRVTLDVRGPRRALSAGVALSAFRIVQESLTNVLRHAGTTRAAVHLRYGDDALTVEVTDDGRGPPRQPDRSGAGHGLLGMRERAHLVGGTLETGVRSGGGFTVTAFLPTAHPVTQRSTASEPAVSGW